MRIQLDETEDGRWTIWIGAWPEGEELAGEWGGVYVAKVTVARVKQLLRAASSAKVAELQRRLRTARLSA